MTGNIKTCLHCKLSKIIKTKISNKNRNKYIKPLERLYIDISSVNTTSYGGSKYWILIVDDCTDKCWSIFIEKKSRLPEQIVELIKKLRSELNSQSSIF